MGLMLLPKSSLPTSYSYQLNTEAGITERQSSGDLLLSTDRQGCMYLYVVSGPQDLEAKMSTVDMATNSIFFKDFCSAMEQIKKKRKNKRDQEQALLKFFNDCRLKIAETADTKSSSFFPILRLILPECERERSPYNLKMTKLGELLVKVLSLNKQSRDAQKLLNYRSISTGSGDSDFAEVAYFVLKLRVGEVSASLTIGDVNSVLDKIAFAEVGNKGPALDEAFTYIIKSLPAEQIKWFLRIVLKDLKIGMGKDRILEALHPDAADTYKVCTDLAEVCSMFEDGRVRPVELGVRVFSACSPMLSDKLYLHKIDRIMSPDKTYQMENKFDGERFQMHMSNGEFKYFSRTGNEYTELFGADFTAGMLTSLLADCFSPSVVSFILDGEMMGWDKHKQCFGSKGMAFDIKKITEKSRFRACFCTFDVLYYNGRPLAGPPEGGGAPLNTRLQILDSMFVDIRGVIMKSKREVINDWSEIPSALNKSMEAEEEGLVVKDMDSYYLPSRRDAGWYKLKPEYIASTMTDLDLVVIGADESESKERGFARSFYIACLDRDESGSSPDRWVCVGKVSTGLRAEQRASLCSRLQQHWSPTARVPPPPQLIFNRKKPQYWILPEDSIVFEIRASELIHNSESVAGYLRFPRILRLRDDKSVSDILTLHALRQLHQDKGSVVKLSTNKVSESEMQELPSLPKRRRVAVEPKVPEHLKPTPVGEVCVTSRALQGREMCVVTAGGEEGGVKELVEIILKHGGKHVANPGPKTWCCVAGKINVRVKGMIKAQSYDVVNASWLRSLPESQELCSLCPLDMICMKKDTRLKMSLDYDKYGDSFNELLDENTLRRIFDNMDAMENNTQIYLTREEMLEVDEKLFDSDSDRCQSFLRPCYLHFLEYSVNVIKAQKYGASICELTHPRLSHVVVDILATSAVEEFRRKTKAKIVSESWIEKCFSERRLVEPEM